MARRRHKNNAMGIMVIVAGLVFFSLFLMLIPTLPFQVTAQEQTVLYMIGFMIMGSALLLLLWDLTR